MNIYSYIGYSKHSSIVKHVLEIKCEYANAYLTKDPLSQVIKKDEIGKVEGNDDILSVYLLEDDLDKVKQLFLNRHKELMTNYLKLAEQQRQIIEILEKGNVENKGVGD